MEGTFEYLTYATKYDSQIHSLDTFTEYTYDTLERMLFVTLTITGIEHTPRGFFGFKDNIDKLNNAKLAYNAASNERNRVEIHQTFSENNDIRHNAEEITLLARQAIDLYRSSQAASIYARPIILYYSFTKLESISFLSVYKSKRAAGNHGLTLKCGESVICKKHGAFPCFL